MKKIIIAFIALVVLALTAWYLNEKPTKTTKEIDKTFFSTDSSKISKVIINSSKSDLTLEKISGEWKIVDPINYKADYNSIRSVLGKLNDISVDNVISEVVTKQKKFEVDSSGVLVEVDNKRFYIGKNSQDYGRTYYRMDGDNRIFVGNMTSKYTFEKDLDGWRDKTINKSSNIEKFTLNHGKISGNFSKDSTDWNLDIKGKISKAKKSDLNGMVSSLKNLRATSFADSLNGKEFTPSFTIDLDGKSLIFNKEGENYFVMVGGKEQVFKISKSIYEKFDKDPKDLIEK